MDLGKIIVFKEFHGIKNYLSVIKPKEIFIHGETKNIDKFLIALKNIENNKTSSVDLDYPLSNENLKFSVISSYYEYNKKNKKSILAIKEYAKINQICLSWLQILQIVEMNKISTIEENLRLLEDVYNKVLPVEKNEEMSFLDF